MLKKTKKPKRALKRGVRKPKASLPTLKIRIRQQTRTPRLNRRKVAAAIKAVLLALNLPDIELSVLFVDAKTMTQFQARFLDRHYPTDILSFPAPSQPRQRGLTRPLGDLLVCLEKVKAYSKKHRKTFNEEFGQVLIHGLLHLKGHDHQTPAELRKMRRLEKKLLPLVRPHFKSLMAN